MSATVLPPGMVGQRKTSQKTGRLAERQPADLGLDGAAVDVEVVIRGHKDS